MERKKVFLFVQAALCALVAGLLAASALWLYFDGAAKQAAGELFSYMFTRERVGERLLPILPLFFCSLGMTAAGWIMGIRDENAEKPAGDEIRSRNLEKAVPQQADRKTLLLRTAVLLAAAILIVGGMLNGGLEDVLAKGIVICAECIGIG